MRLSAGADAGKGGVELGQHVRALGGEPFTGDGVAKTGEQHAPEARLARPAA